MNSVRRLLRRTPSPKCRGSNSKRQFIRRGLMAERLETRAMLAGDFFLSDFWNGAKPQDVNADSHITPIDALLVINELNSNGSHQVTGINSLASPQPAAAEGEESEATPTYYDVNNDGYVSPIDALMVVNALNGEGEPDMVQLRLYVVPVGTQVSELATPPTSITSISKGQDYELVVTVKDLRGGSPLGVGVAHLDLFYDKALTLPFVREARDIVFSGALSGGTFTLTFGAQTTPAITFDALDAEVTRGNIETALRGLSNINGNNVFVTKETTGRYRVYFDNALGDQDITAALTANGSGLTGSGGVTTEQVANGVLSDPVAFRDAFRSRVDYPNATNDAFYRGQANSASSLPQFFAGNLSDRVDDLGGNYITPFPPFPVSNVFERELSRVRMNANEAGFVFFTPSLAEIDIAHQMGVYTTMSSDQTVIPPSEVSFGPDIGFGEGVIRLEIVEQISANDDLNAMVAEDSVAGVTINVLANDTKNAGAPAGTIELRSVNTAGITGSVTIDDNGTPGNATDDRIRYVPAPNFAGIEEFTYTIGLVNGTNHPATPTDTGTVRVTVNAVNDAPVNLINGVPITGATPARNATEDTAFVFNAASSSLISISDVDAGAATNLQTVLTVTNGTVNAVENANVTIQNDNSSTVTLTGSLAGINAALNGMVFNPTPGFPFANTTGVASIQIQTSDMGNTGSGPVGVDTDTLSINVAAVNDPPMNAVPGMQTMDENVAPGGSSLVFNATNGNAITVDDPDAGTNAIDVTVAVSTGTLTLGSTTGLTIVGGANNSSSVTIRGTISAINNNGLNGLTYVPPVGFIDTATLTVTTNDRGFTGSGGALQDVDTVDIVVEAIQRPRARNNAYTTTEGVAFFDMNVMFDGLPDLPNPGEMTTLQAVTQPMQTGPLMTSRGTVQRWDPETGAALDADLTDDIVRYTPPSPDFFGTVTFTYSIWDTGSMVPGTIPDHAIATVTLTITPVNDQPVANVDPAFMMDEDTTLTTTISPVNQSLLTNDTDVDNNFDPDNDGDIDVTNTLTAQVVPGSLSDAGGSLTVNPNGTFSYTPSLNHNAVTTFQYRVNDGQGQANSLSDPVMVTININPINDKPVGQPDPYTVAEDGTLTADGMGGNPAGVLANDDDGDPEVMQMLTAAIVGTPPTGLSFSSDGTFTYSPPGNFNGQVTFQYRADDGEAQNNLSDPITVTITVTAVNDPPTAGDDNVPDAVEDTPRIINVLSNDNDGDPEITQTLTPQLVGVNGGMPATHGTLTVNANGTITYTPFSNFNGSTSFEYRVSDGIDVSNTATVSITVAAVNDLPVAVNDGSLASPIVTPEDTSIDIDVVANDDDGDPELTQTLTPVNLSAVTPAGAGTVTVLGNGMIRFTPAADFSGPASFTYRARDDGSPQATSATSATVFINVTEENDPPTAFDDFFTAIKDFDDQVIDVINGDLPHDTAAPDVGETLSVIGVSTDGTAGSFGTTATTAQGGTVRIVGGQVLYDSPPGFQSPPQDTFFYRLSDGRTGTDDAMVTVEVLAFVPKFVEGVVYIDGDNNGQIFAGESFTDSNGNGVYDAGEPFVDTASGPRHNSKYDPPEKRVQGVDVQLAGTDFQGNPVFFETTTDATGHYRFVGDATTQFQGLQPGTYTVTQIQPSYLSDGQETESSALASISANDKFQISWGPQDFSGHITGLNFAELGINAGSLADSGGLIQELLASSGPNGMVITTNMAGAYIWSWTMPGWTNMISCQLQLDADLAHATLTVTDGQGTRSIRIHQDPHLNNGSGSPASGSLARFRILGRSATGEYIIRLDGTARDFFGSDLVAAAPVPSAPEGEGEAAGDRQYAEAVDAVFGSGDAWA